MFQSPGTGLKLFLGPWPLYFDRGREAPSNYFVIVIPEHTRCWIRGGPSYTETLRQ